MPGKETSKKRKAAPVVSTTPKKIRKTTKAETKATIAPEPVNSTASSKEPASEKEDEIIFEDEAQTTEPEDDQTAALLKGFESSEDEEETGVDTAEIAEIPSIPNSVSLQSKLSAAATKPSDQPGVVYVGRIPHGFYEHQMRAYFSQFGDILRLRLSRNRTTGASKHYAFIEFSSAEVASIVADAMDNYLMFGHLLKVKLVPKERVHEELFKGAGKRFKKIPWNRIDRFRVQGTDRQGWESRIKSEEKRRIGKAEKLKELGYEFQMPKLREVADVPIPAVTDTPTKAIEDVPPPATVPKDEVALAHTENDGKQLKTDDALVSTSETKPKKPKTKVSATAKPNTKNDGKSQQAAEAVDLSSKKSAKGSKDSVKRALKSSKH